MYSSNSNQWKNFNKVCLCKNIENSEMFATDFIQPWYIIYAYIYIYIFMYVYIYIYIYVYIARMLSKYVNIYM